MPTHRLHGRALAAIAAVEADYPRHRAAAFEVAREHLAADRVLLELLQSIQNPEPARTRSSE